jgi:hypothetical protein
MKKIFFSIIFVLLALHTFGQNGYREFYFGMSVEDVGTIRPEIKKDDFFFVNFLTFIMQSQYNSELISTIPNPRTNMTGTFTRYITGEYLTDRDLTFYFHDNKLVAIETYFRNTNVLNELIQQYGNSFNVHLSNTDDAKVWNNQSMGRFITWEKVTVGGNRSWEEVIYIDHAWITNLCRITIEDFRRAESNPRNRLD